MGRTHAGVGAVVGLSYGQFVAHLPLPQTAMLTVFTAGLAVLPDIDHPQATMAHSFGFLTKSFAWTVGRISGGHRWGTHSIIGTAVLTGLAMAAVHWRHDLAGRIGLGFLLSLTFAAVFCATFAGRLAVKELRHLPGLRHVPVKHVTEGAAIGIAVLLAFTGWGLALVGLATVLGCVAHIGTDMLTKERCPLLYPLSRIRFGLLPEDLSFTTDTWPEHLIVAPVAGVAFLVLTARGVLVAVDPAAWASLMHAITLTPHLI